MNKEYTKSRTTVEMEIVNKANDALPTAFENQNSAMVAAIAELLKSVNG